MPYIKPIDRPIFNTIIDGLIKRARCYDRATIRTVVANFVIAALTRTRTPFPASVGPTTDSIIMDLAQRVRVRGDANYCLCRIVLESMKPDTGWSYHSLSDTILVLESAIGLVYDVADSDDPWRTSELVYDAMSALADAAKEIRRRLLDPYEDKAILKNGDMACFANEDFAYMPLDTTFLELVGDPISGCACTPLRGCACTPLSGCSGGCEPSPAAPKTDCRHRPIDKSKIPLVTDALTDEQVAKVEADRDEWSAENIAAEMVPLMKGQPADFPRTIRTESSEEVDRAARTQG